MLATERYNGSDPVNLGTGCEISIRDLVMKLSDIMKFRGDVIWDTSKPNGQPRRCLDVTRAFREFGFKSEIGFDAGLNETVEWYRAQTELA